MGDKTGVSSAVAITVPLACLVIYFAVRNFFASIRNVRDAIGTEVARRRQLDAKSLREGEAVVSSAAHAPQPTFAPVQPEALDGPASPEPAAASVLPLRPVAVVRKPRERDRDWSQDRSWFGGLPRLGGAAWPRGSNGTPLPFAAQIDLAEVAAACPESPLPRQGSLAFFLNEGAVIDVPDGDHAPTEPPEDLDDLLLLQIGYDDMNEWRFGDMGLWHFRISPADASAGRWTWPS